MKPATSRTFAAPAPVGWARILPEWVFPILLVPVVLAIDSYHPWAGDAGIYVAGVRHIVDPQLYPLNAIFVTAFTHLSVFAWLLAAATRWTHLSLSRLLLPTYLFSIWLLLEASRGLARLLFSDGYSRVCAVLLMAGCYALPVAGTALFIADPYVTARSFSTPLSLFAIAACLDRAWLRTALLVAATLLLHPLMGSYAAALIVLLALSSAGHTRAALALCSAGIIACGIAFWWAHGAPISPAYRECVALPPRTFLFLARWHWYEVLGMVLPLLLLAFGVRRFGVADSLGQLCLAGLMLGGSSTLIAAFFVPRNGPYLLVPLQVLRSFDPIYAVGIVLCGGVLARFRIAAGLALAILLTGMFFAQGASWPQCDRIEWPGRKPSNPYEQAFLWIRRNTPPDAVFAFDPRFDYRSGEDEQGFRAMTERDQLADDKDAGVAAVIPSLATRWAAQRNAELYVDGMSDKERLQALMPLGATWILLSPGARTGFPCPYANGMVRVCRMKR